MLLNRASLLASRLAPALIAGGLLAGVVSCKPTAFISPLTLNFQNIHSTGAIGNECAEVAADTRPQLSFTLVDTNQQQMFPGHRLGKFELTLVGAPPTLTPDNLSIDNSQATLYPAPDVICDESAADGAPCPDPLLAAAGFQCRPLTDVEIISNESCATSDDCSVAGHVCDAGSCKPPTSRVCALNDFPLSISPNASVSFDGEASSRQSVILLLSNGGSALGIDDQGVPNGQTCSTDPFDQRTRAATLMLGILGNETNAFSRTTDLCVGAFAGQSEPDYRFETSPADCLRPVAEGTTDQAFLATEIARLANQETPDGRNPWGALIDAIGRFDEWGARGNRHIVLVTDGDVSADVLETTIALQQTFQRAMDLAIAANVRIHIVQWDRPGRPADCFPANTEGAMEEFGRLACATNGSYTFVERPEDLSEFLQNLGRSIPGRYSIPIVADGLATLPLGPYKAAFTLSATVDGQRASFELAARSGAGSTGRQDTRMTIVNRAACADGARECLDGYICEEPRLTCHTPVPGEGAVEEPPEEPGEGDEE